MNIDNFKGAFDNLAKPTHFRVSGIGGRELEFLCKGAGIPASTLGVIEVPHMGRKVKIAGNRTYQELSLTVLLTNNYEVRTYFEEWSDSINGAETNVGLTSVEAYKNDLFIEQLDSEGNAVAEYTLVGCWPSEISQIDLNAESVDTVSEFTVTMQFDYSQKTA